MGSQFAIAFDLISVAIVVVMFFAGWGKGLARMVLGLAASIVAFVAAMILSTPIANAIYSNYVEAPLNEKIDEAVDKSFADLSLDSFSDVDYDCVFISGTVANSISPDYSGRDGAVVDLTNVDLSTIGLTVEDLAFLGLEPSFDLRSVNMKTAEFTKSEVEKHGLGKLAVAQFIAVSLIEKGDLEDFNKFIEIIDNYIPVKKALTTADNVTVSYARKLVLGMIDSRASLSNTVMTSFVRPNCIIVIRSLTFIFIYLLILGLMKFIANASKIIDKIPVVGDINSLLGGIAGAVEGILMVFIFCLVTRLIISVLGEGTMIFNQETIDNTIFFKRLYEFNFLNFLT